MRLTSVTPLPFVRPRSNVALWSWARFALITGHPPASEEYVYDHDTFTYHLSFLEDDANHRRSLIVRVTAPLLSSLWKTGAQDLICHFFPSYCNITLESPSEHSTAADDATASLVIRIDSDGIVGEPGQEDALGQKLGYIRYFLLTGPVFKQLRRAVYGSLVSEPRIALTRDLTVWLFCKQNEFALTLWDNASVKSTSLMAYSAFVLSFAQAVNIRLARNHQHTAEGGENAAHVPANDDYALPRRLLAIKRQIGHQLYFRCVEGGPTPEVFAWHTRNNSSCLSLPDLTTGRWFQFNFLRYLGTREVELLSIAKIVVGLRPFLRASYHHRGSNLRHHMRAAAKRIAELAKVPCSARIPEARPGYF